MQDPKVSIIVPVYNAEKYLEECIQSIMNQTLGEIEIICVDDGSTDSSPKILKQLSNVDKRIKIITQKNQYVSVARNNAIKIAAAPYLMFVDSDDTLDKKTCEIAYKTIENDNSDVVMYCFALSYDKKTYNQYSLGIEKKIFDKNECFNKLYRHFFGLLPEELNMVEQQDRLNPVWAMIYKRSIINENHINFVDIRNIGCNEDGLFNINYFEFVTQATYIPEILYYYRRDNVDSNTSNFKSELPEQLKVLHKLMENEINKKNLPIDFKTALENRRALSIIGLGLNAVVCKCSFWKKTKMVRKLLFDKDYCNAVKKIQLKSMKMHWKFFIFSAKHKMSFAVTVLLMIINKLRRVKHG